MAGRTARRVPLEMGPSILTTCLVQTLNASDKTFQRRFLKRLERAYTELQNDPVASPHSIEQLAWVYELLTGLSMRSGFGKPFLKV